MEIEQEKRLRKRIHKLTKELQEAYWRIENAIDYIKWNQSDTDVLNAKEELEWAIRRLDKLGINDP